MLGTICLFQTNGFQVIHGNSDHLCCRFQRNFWLSFSPFWLFVLLVGLKLDGVINVNWAVVNVPLFFWYFSVSFLPYKNGLHFKMICSHFCRILGLSSCFLGVPLFAATAVEYIGFMQIGRSFGCFLDFGVDSYILFICFGNYGTYMLFFVRISSR
jgi:hypothetical protein